MHKAKDEELYLLPCPKCGNIPDENDIIAKSLWDQSILVLYRINNKLNKKDLVLFLCFRSFLLSYNKGIVDN